MMLGSTVAVLDDQLAIDLAGSTIYGHYQHHLTMNLSTQLASHDLQRSACIVCPMPRLWYINILIY